MKPFYTNIRAVAEHGSKLLVLGINPGGSCSRHQKEARAGMLTALKDPKLRPWSAFLDEANLDAPRRNPYRSFVLQLGDQMWESREQLRIVPFGNLCPFRTPSTKRRDMHADVWREGSGWGWSLIKTLQPRVLLLLGNSNSRSGWGLLREKDQFLDTSEGPRHGRTLLWKRATLVWDAENSTQVVALPHPATRLQRKVLEELESMSVDPSWAGIWAVCRSFRP